MQHFMKSGYVQTMFFKLGSGAVDKKTRHRDVEKDTKTDLETSNSIASNLDTETDDESILKIDADGETTQGWDLDCLCDNMFAFVDASDNIVYKKIDDEINAANKVEMRSRKDNESEEDKQKEWENEEHSDFYLGYIQKFHFNLHFRYFSDIICP